LVAIFQTAGGEELYPSLEEKAAHLLYFVVKNHPFVDGNKRIGAALFLRFMEKNGALYQSGGMRRLTDEAVVALTLLIAESAPRDKDTIVRLVAYLLQKQKIEGA
jgi:prophage maintenance system killer protein